MLWLKLPLPGQLTLQLWKGSSSCEGKFWTQFTTESGQQLLFPWVYSLQFPYFPGLTLSQSLSWKDNAVCCTWCHTELWQTEQLSYSRFQKSNDQNNWHDIIKIRNTVVLSSNASKGQWQYDFKPITFHKQKLRSKEHGKLTAAENVNVKVLWWWQSFWSDWC